jgi:hypothetical protein
VVLYYEGTMNELLKTMQLVYDVVKRKTSGLLLESTT